MKKGIVIGSGIGGLAAAIRLALKGYEVEVYESNPYPGGKLSEIRDNGFRFDAGPSLFTMPELVDELFLISGRDPKEFFNYERLNEVCRYFYEDGTRLNVPADPEQFAIEAEKATGIDAKKVRQHLKRSAYIYDTTAFLFLRSSLHRFQTYLSFKTLLSFLQLPLLPIFSSMNSVNRKHLGNKKMVQLFNRYATYNGSNPFRAPGILNIIPHLEFNKGAYFPKEGMHSITLALFQLAKDLGVRFFFDSPVDEILVSRKKVTGVSVRGVEKKAQLVICNMDISFAYPRLLPKIKPPIKTLKLERSSSAIIFYWGIRGKFEELGLHNILFSDDYRTEFSYLFDKKDVYEDPTVYINITSKLNPKDAPEGRENWFVMINAPYMEGQDWDNIIRRSRQFIVEKLNKSLGKNIEELIEFEQVLEPRTIESKTKSFKGALYGTSSNNRMAAFFRHPNFSRRIRDLYFVGGSVHPGGGIPLALSSAKIVDGLIPKA